MNQLWEFTFSRTTFDMNIARPYLAQPTLLISTDLVSSGCTYRSNNLQFQKIHLANRCIKEWAKEVEHPINIHPGNKDNTSV